MDGEKYYLFNFPMRSRWQIVLGAVHGWEGEPSLSLSHRRRNSSLVFWFYFGLFVFTCPTQMKVPFEEVPELVAGRRVFIHKGYAYVAMDQVIIIIPSC